MLFGVQQSLSSCMVMWILGDDLFRVLDFGASSRASSGKDAYW